MYTFNVTLRRFLFKNKDKLSFWFIQSLARVFRIVSFLFVEYSCINKFPFNI